MHALGRFRKVYLFVIAAVLFLQPGSRAQFVNELAKKGDKLYTQFSLYYEKDHHITTNYRKGILIPINTEVEFISSSRSQIKVNIPSYKLRLNIENVENYSGEKISGIFKRTLGIKPVDLSGFTETEQKLIKRGTIIEGMSKEAVIKAMGYPPQHKTPTLEMDQWRYWKNRFDTTLVSFEDGKVVDIKD